MVFLVLVAAEVPDLVIQGTAGLGGPALSASPLVGSFGIWVGPKWNGRLQLVSICDRGVVYGY